MSGATLSLALIVFLGGSYALAEESVLTTSLPAASEAPAPSLKPYQMGFKVALSSRSFDDEVSTARYARSVIGMTGSADFTDYLSGNIAAAQYFTSGAASNLYGTTEVTAGLNGALIEEAALTLKPVSFASLKGGILKTTLNPVSTLMGDQNWMAATANVNGDVGNLNVAGIATQGTPTSRDPSNRVVDDGTLPLFTSGTLKGEYKFGDSGLVLSTAASRFIFTDLSAAAAADSQKIGSSVVGNGKGVYDFLYDYRGTEYGAKIKQTFVSESELSLETSLIQNEQAPSGQNQGRQVKLSSKYASDRWNLYGDLTNFRIESDCLPASYGPLFLGFTNRIGNAASIKYEHKKSKISVYGSYTQADVLDRNVVAATYQGDRQIYAIGAEVKYDLF